MNSDERDQQRMEAAPTALEWAVRGVSVTMTVLLLGFLLYQGLQPHRPPEFAAEPQLDQVGEHAGAYSLPVRVRNEGTASVSELTVTVVLLDGGEPVEKESIVVPLLGHGEQVTVVAWFDADPRAHEVDVDIGTYTEA